MERDRQYLATLSPELRILVLSAGPASVEEELRAAVEREGVDWELVMELADFERATSVMWRRIRSYAHKSMPAATRAKFEQLALIADFGASYLEQRASETLSALSIAGVEAIVLKGVALAVSVYGSFFERPMGDIDLLVDASRAEDAWRVSQDVGWKWDAAKYPLHNYANHPHLPPLHDSRGRLVRLEMHASLFVEGSPFQLSISDLRAHGTVMPIGVNGGKAVVPCREHLLLHTCIHLAWAHMMSFGAWRALRDVVALTTSGINWEFFEAEAKRNRAESCAYWTLRFTERLVGADVPADTMMRLSRVTDTRLRRAAERHFEREIFPIGLHCPSQLLRRFLWEAGIQPKESAHGSARPWDLDEEVTPTDLARSDGAEGELGNGASGRWAQVSDILQYVRMLTH